MYILENPYPCSLERSHHPRLYSRDCSLTLAKDVLFAIHLKAPNLNLVIRS